MRVLKSRFMRIFLVSVLILSFSLSSAFASSTVRVPYAEPPTGNTQGYVTVKRANGYVDTFYWTVTPISAEAPSSSTVSVTVNSSGLVFVMGGTSGVTYRATLIQLNTSSAVLIRYSGSFTSTETVNYSFSTSNIIEFSARGNFGNVVNNIGSSANLSVQFETDSSNNLSSLADILNQQVNSLDDIYEILESLKDYAVQDGSNRVYNSIFAEFLSSQDTTLTDIKKLLSYLEDYAVDNDSGYIYNALFKNLLNSQLDVLEDMKSLLEYLEDYEVDDDSGYVYNALFKKYYLEIIDILEQFRDTKLDESTDPLPDDNLADFDSSSSDLRNESDVSTSLDDVFNDSNVGSFSNGFAVVWNLVERIYNSNPVFFTILTLVLSLGLIQLILNRR